MNTRGYMDYAGDYAALLFISKIHRCVQVLSSLDLFANVYQAY